MGATQGSFLGSLECIGLMFFKKGSNSYSYVNISSLSSPRASRVAQRTSFVATEDCWSFNVEEMVGSYVQFQKITTKGFAMRGQRGETERSVKTLPAVQETWVQSLGQEEPLEKGMAAHSSILAWRIPWTEEPGGLQSMGSERVGHNWVTEQHHHLSKNVDC